MKNLKTKTCNFGEQNFSIAYVDILDGTKLCFIFDKSYYLINPQSNGGDLEIYKMLSTNGEFQKVEEVEIYHKCGEIYESFLHDLKKMDEEIEDFYNNEKYIYLAKLACHFDLG